MNARFTTDFCVRKVRTEGARARWCLLAPLVYWSALTRDWYTVPAGEVTDLASVPRLPLAFLLAGDRAHEAAALHDYLYRVRRHSREVCDRIFLEAVQAMGHGAALARLMYAGVRIGGASAYEVAP